MKYFYVTLFLLASLSAGAQAVKGITYDRNSLDLSFGYSQPLNYFEGGDFGTNFGLNQVKIGFRHMFNNTWGLRANFNYHRYITETSVKNSSQMSAFNIEAVYNLGRATGLLLSSNRKATLMGYAGIGYGLHKTPDVEKREQFLPINLGLTSSINVNNIMAFTLDFGPIFNYQQDRGFDGQYTDLPKKYDGTKTGISMQFSLGIQIFIGSWPSHADFY